MKKIFERIEQYIWKNPIFKTELLRRLRSNKMVILQSIYLIVLSVALYITWGEGYNYYNNNPFYISQRIFYALLTLLVTSVLILCPSFTCSSISSEMEKKTFDLLITSLLSPREIVAGKLNSITVYTALLLCSSIPVSCTVFFFGGISYIDLLLAYIFILLTGILISMVSIFISAKTKKTNASIGLSYGIAFVMFIFIMASMDSIRYSSNFSPFTSSIDFHIFKIPFSILFVFEALFVLLLLFISTAGLIERPARENTVTQIRTLFSLFYIMNTVLLSLAWCANMSSWTIEYFFYWLMFFLLLLAPFFVWPSSDMAHQKKSFFGIFRPNTNASIFLIPFLTVSGLIISSFLFIYFCPASNLAQIISASFIISVFIYSMTVAGKWVSRFFVTEDTFTICFLVLFWFLPLLSWLIRGVHYNADPPHVLSVVDPFLALKGIWNVTDIDPIFFIIFYSVLAAICHILIYIGWPEEVNFLKERKVGKVKSEK
ncbi:MAG: hypothetical protein ABRQ38_21785 [Candidatus Eremiobacterota bacterium]